MGLKKGFNYPDQHLACPECGKTFKNGQALLQHQRAHLAAGVKLAAPTAVGTPSGSSLPQQPTEQMDSKSNIQRLEEEVRTLKLEAEKRRLEASTVSAVKPPDIMSSSGAGEISGQAKEIAQMRILGLAGQQSQPESWLTKFLAQPGGIETAARALKGILGVESRTGDGLEILERLGINLRDLLKPQTPVTPGGTLKIGGLDLSGQPLSPELLVAIINHQSRMEQAKAEAESRNYMASSWDKIASILAPMITKKLDGSVPNSGISKNASGRDIHPQRIFVCTKCGGQVEVPYGIPAGGHVTCSACGDQYEITVEDTKQQTKKDKPTPERVEVKEPERILMKCRCGQQLDVTDLPLLSEIKCPVCGAIATITDPDQPLPVKPLTQQEKYQSLADKNAEGKRLL